MTTNKSILTEGLPLPPDIETECDQVAELIASMFLPYFKRRIEHMKTASPERVVKYNEYYRMALEYKKNTRYFKYYKSHGINSTWGEIDFFIRPINQNAPGIFLKIDKGNDVSVDGYVEKDNPKTIFIMTDAYYFIKAFKKSTDYLREVVKHETRHSIQIKGEWDGNMKGLPKVRVQDPERDPYGMQKRGYGRRSAHAARDIEFKPNIHTYAYHIKQYLNRNYPKSRWAEGLTTLLSFKGVFGRDDAVIKISNILDELRLINPEKWRVFMKELYKEIFKHD